MVLALILIERVRRVQNCGIGDPWNNPKRGNFGFYWSVASICGCLTPRSPTVACAIDLFFQWWFWSRLQNRASIMARKTNGWWCPSCSLDVGRHIVRSCPVATWAITWHHCQAEKSHRKLLLGYPKGRKIMDAWLPCVFPIIKPSLFQKLTFIYKPSWHHFFTFWNN